MQNFVPWLGFTKPVGEPVGVAGKEPGDIGLHILHVLHWVHTVLPGTPAVYIWRGIVTSNSPLKIGVKCENVCFVCLFVCFLFCNKFLTEYHWCRQKTVLLNTLNSKKFGNKLMIHIQFVKMENHGLELSVLQTYYVGLVGVKLLFLINIPQIFS